MQNAVVWTYKKYFFNSNDYRIDLSGIYPKWRSSGKIEFYTKEFIELQYYQRDENPDKVFYHLYE